MGDDNLLVICVYISPNVSDETYGACLQDIQDTMAGKGECIILGGDFNAKSPLWGSPLEDRRGTLLADWIASTNLMVINEGNMPTFQRDASQSILDLTLATEGG